MSQRVLITRTSDLSNEEIDQTGDGTDFRFTYRGRSYSIDLTDSELAEFDAAVEKYVRAASKVTGKRKPRPYLTQTAPDPRAVRAYAAANGIEVSRYGRPPRDLVEKFLAAGN